MMPMERRSEALKEILGVDRGVVHKVHEAAENRGDEEDDDHLKHGDGRANHLCHVRGNNGDFCQIIKCKQIFRRTNRFLFLSFLLRETQKSRNSFRPGTAFVVILLRLQEEGIQDLHLRFLLTDLS